MVIRNELLLTHLMDYPGTPVSKISYQGFLSKLLVTGGIYGYSNTGEIKSFPGANLKVTKPINTEAATNIYLANLFHSDIFCEERLLQNYARQALNYRRGV
ncbi:hypothetical protein EDC94DRAFT_589488 [Helicostylum pulchrum]|nr:hypothetical protein EDC94DRAFT_589488 [Helicostylum pulchrum]